MDLTSRVILQRKKLENVIDSIENARISDGINDRFMLWLRGELQVIDNGLAAIELVLEKGEIVE